MRFIREMLQTLLLGLFIYLLLQATLQTYRVYGASMEPNLQHGQYLLISKAVYFQAGSRYLFHPPRRGEVVVFRLNKTQETVYIKRIIGLPGETVEVRDGKVLVNGRALAEPYLTRHPAYAFSPRVVPPGTYFVLGDNRNASADSHQWEQVGPVPAQNIVGKAWLSFWPPKALGWAPNYSFAR